MAHVRGWPAADESRKVPTEVCSNAPVWYKLLSTNVIVALYALELCIVLVVGCQPGRGIATLRAKIVLYV
jgi:hypothetical protein